MHDYLPAGFWPLLQNQSLKIDLCRPRELSVNPKQHNMPLAKDTQEQMRTKVIYQSGTGDKAISRRKLMVNLPRRSRPMKITTRTRPQLTQEVTKERRTAINEIIIEKMYFVFTRVISVCLMA